MHVHYSDTNMNLCIYLQYLLIILINQIDLFSNSSFVHDPPMLFYFVGDLPGDTDAWFYTQELLLLVLRGPYIQRIESRLATCKISKPVQCYS